MGYIRHHAIIVTGTNFGAGSDTLDMARQMAVDLFGQQVSPTTDSKCNGYESFLVAPDGSKEGWAESDKGDELRKDFITFLRSPNISGWLSWVEVQYGDDGRITRVVDHSDNDKEDA